MRNLPACPLLRLGAAVWLATSLPAWAGEEAPLGPECRDEGLELAFRAPEGIDPGASQPLEGMDGRVLAFFFQLPGADPVHVKIESYPGLEDVHALVRRRKGAPGETARAPRAEAPFAGGGFEAGTRLTWPAEGGAVTEEIFLKRFRTVTVVTFRLAEADTARYAPLLEAMIGSLRSTATSPRGLPVPAGWRVERTENFEIATDAEPPVSKAAGDLLEAVLRQIHRTFPDARKPEYGNLVRFFGSEEGFAAFRDAAGAPDGVSALVLEDARVIATGVLRRGRFSRRFVRAEIDVLEVARCVFTQFVLHGAGARPEPWFLEGAALHLGLGFGNDARFSGKRAEAELAVEIEEDLTAGTAPSPEEILAASPLDERGRRHAASWVCFLLQGPGRTGKTTLQDYFRVFAETWDGEAARSAAFAGEDLAKLARTHARWALYNAMQAKRRR